MTGLILLDKPTGISTFAALGRIKKILETKKVGHTGTLDPFASGLVVALSGNFTKLSPLLTAMKKEYHAVFAFGEETDTLDTEGRVTARGPVPSESAILQAASSFRGTFLQIPPDFSAVKVKGKRAYQMARKGEAPKLPPREVTVETLEILSWTPPNLELRISCSKGTYIRSLARDLARTAGSRAHCQALRRTAVGDYSVEQAVSPEDFERGDLRGPQEVLASMGVPPPLVVNDQEVEALRQGVPAAGIPSLAGKQKGRILVADKEGTPVVFFDFQDAALVPRILI